MDTILIAIISITLIGAFCATLLSVASKVMYVAVDERITKLESILPGTNCGACGFPGCAGYATAIVEDSTVKTNLCTPGGETVVSMISEIMGVAKEDVISNIATIHCGGENQVREKKMNYKGIETCMAATAVHRGENACSYGCMGYGDCLKACPCDAICLVNGLARINRNLCTGCGLCVPACPHKLITIQNSSVKTVIACANKERGAVARKKCSRCCIGCKRCDRECPERAIIVENDLAIINVERCIRCGHCADICPTKCIHYFTS